METPIVELYSGDSWECEMLQSMLADAEIECFLQNNLPAAYAGASSTVQEVKVMIRESDFVNGSEVVKKFLENRKNEMADQ